MQNAFEHAGRDHVIDWVQTYCIHFDQNFIITGGRKIDVIDPQSRGFTIAFKRKRFHRLLIHLSFTLPGLPVACFLTTLLLSEKTILSPMPNPP